MKSPTPLDIDHADDVVLLLEDPVSAVDVAPPLSIPLPSPVGEAENFHAVGSPYVAESGPIDAVGSPFVAESEPIYDDGSPYSVDFYDPKIVPETEQENLDPPLPKLLSCFVSIAPLLVEDTIIDAVHHSCSLVLRTR